MKRGLKRLSLRLRLGMLRRFKQLPLFRASTLRWQLARLNTVYEQSIAEAEYEKKHDQAESLTYEWWHHRDLVEEELQSVRSYRLVKQANTLDLAPPRPHYGKDEGKDEYWERGTYTGHWYLKPAGFKKLRDEIRAEKQARWEARGHWLAWLSALTGIIGALTGLLAVWGRP